MLNRTYNNIIRIIGFVFTMGFVAVKILGIIDKSWWYVFVPIIITSLFLKHEEHIYIVRNAEEIEELEGISEDDVEPENDDDSDEEPLGPSTIV